MLSIILALTTAALQIPTFGGYDCHNDCSGIANGYAWAQEHGILLIGTCVNRDEDFQNGCLTYLADPYRGSTQDDQGGDIDQ